MKKIILFMSLLATLLLPLLSAAADSTGVLPATTTLGRGYLLATGISTVNPTAENHKFFFTMVISTPGNLPCPENITSPRLTFSFAGMGRDENTKTGLRIYQVPEYPLHWNGTQYVTVLFILTEEPHWYYGTGAVSWQLYCVPAVGIGSAYFDFY